MVACTYSWNLCCFSWLWSCWKAGKNQDMESEWAWGRLASTCETSPPLCQGLGFFVLSRRQQRIHFPSGLRGRCDSQEKHIWIRSGLQCCGVNIHLSLDVWRERFHAWCPCPAGLAQRVPAQTQEAHSSVPRLLAAIACGWGSWEGSWPPWHVKQSSWDTEHIGGPTLSSSIMIECGPAKAP